MSIKLKSTEWIAGLEKGLSVIEAFDSAHPRLTATEAGTRCGLTRTAARRYLKTLAHLGYVGSDGKHFWLMPRVLRSAMPTWHPPACLGWCSPCCSKLPPAPKK